MRNFAKCDYVSTRAYTIVNDLNKNYRWLKFWIGEDGYITADMDAIVYPGSVGRECAEVILRMSKILESAIESLKEVADVSKEEENAIRFIGLLQSLKSMG